MATIGTVASTVVPFGAARAQSVCAQCHLCGHCLPAGLSGSEISQFDKMIGARIRIKRGQHLYQDGAAFSAIFVVKSGFFKTNLLTEGGHVHVTGFQMAGEILGMDGIGNEIHPGGAVALEDSDVCRIALDDFEQLSGVVRTLQSQFHKAMSREIVRNHDMIMLLGTLHSWERVATFLLNLSQRMTARGLSPTEFHLRMTREEIGSYLGLRLETVSRLFSRFQEGGIILVEQRHVRILDIPGLKRLLTHGPASLPGSVSATQGITLRPQSNSRGPRSGRVLN